MEFTSGRWSSRVAGLTTAERKTLINLIKNRGRVAEEQLARDEEEWITFAIHGYRMVKRPLHPLWFEGEQSTQTDIHSRSSARACDVLLCGSCAGLGAVQLGELLHAGGKIGHTIAYRR